MTEIKDIFLWFRGLPVKPNNLTTIQQEEWQRKEKDKLLMLPFVGQTLSVSPATIRDISRETITASAFYSLDYNLLADGVRCSHWKSTHVSPYASAIYSISYERARYSEQSRSINVDDMVELGGVIKSVSGVVSGVPGVNGGQIQLTIQLSLTSLNKIEPRFLHAELIDESLHYKESRCFIATVAFGADDCPEVVALKTYRDNRLSNSPVGRVFIDLYYRLSPALSRIIGASAILRRTTRFVIRKSILPLINQ